MPARTFAVVRDQDGDRKEATLADIGDLQAQGYRIADVAGYAAALNEGAEPAPPPELSPAEAAMAERTAADASATAAEHYPEAKPAAADKPAGKKR